MYTISFVSSIMCRVKPKKGLGVIGIMTLCGVAKHGHGSNPVNPDPNVKGFSVKVYLIF